MHFFALLREQKFGKYESTTFAEMLNSKNANEPYIFCKTSVEEQEGILYAHASIWAVEVL